MQAVGHAADKLARDDRITDSVLFAAWLHDVGYAPALAVTGFHPLDGATFLEGAGASDRVVSLVAYHSGALNEATERGLNNALSRFPCPERSDLDVLTLLDMSTGPDGSRVDPADRIGEILQRYEPDSPVHRGVTRSRDDLLAACLRAQERLGLPNKRRGSSV